MSEKQVSASVIRRLPRYYRFLGMLAENGVQRISSGELSSKMGLTASQIRQDLNCFGGFGQQGYGYKVLCRSGGCPGLFCRNRETYAPVKRSIRCWQAVPPGP